ncbi:MAG TPA: acyl-CoA dehydrogenase family protein [Spirochaetota bacterium]|nr:acyl-CoA dehydrogenase family protein [Spirochaetota bacterium]
MNFHNTCNSQIAEFQDVAKIFSNRRLLNNIEFNDEYPFSNLIMDYIDDMASLGFFSINLPQEFGGIDCERDVISALCLEIAQVDASIATIILTNASALSILNQDRKDGDTILPELKHIGSKPIAFQLYSHIDALSLPEYTDGKVNGMAKMVSCAPIADYAILPVKYNHSVSYCCINIHDTGVTISDPIVTLGLHACPVANVYCNSCNARIIGLATRGHHYFSVMYSDMALCASSILLGIMKGSFKQALAYTLERHQGGRAIIHWPQVRMMLSEMKLAIDSAETSFHYLMNFQLSTALYEQYVQSFFLTLSNSAIITTSIGIQLLGGNGYTKDYGQEKRLRDARQAKSFYGMHSLKKMNFINDYIKRM